jgi:hypothetical protein
MWEGRKALVNVRIGRNGQEGKERKKKKRQGGKMEKKDAPI